MCSGVRCGYNKICSEHGGRAICCEKHSYTAHSRRAMLHRTLDAVNEFGEDCSLRYEHHGKEERDRGGWRWGKREESVRNGSGEVGAEKKERREKTGVR